MAMDTKIGIAAMPAHEDDDEMETLCRAYEHADEEGRNLIRLVSELSVLQEQ